MQVSIYLDPILAEKLNRKARRAKKSRSQFIQSLLRSVFFKSGEKTVFDEVCGILSYHEAEKLLHVIQTSRQNSSRFD